MDIQEASKKLKDAGLISRVRSHDGTIVGGTHKTYTGNIGVIEGGFVINIEQLEQRCIKIEIYKQSLEEAVQFLIDNVKPGISDEPPPRSDSNFY